MIVYTLFLSVLYLILPRSEAQLHIATTHTAETLLPLLEAEGLLAPAAAPPAPRHSPTLAASSYPAKRCAVRLAMEDVIQPSRLEHLLEKSHTCDLPYCSQVTQSFSFIRVVGPHWFQCGSGSSFLNYLIADPDPYPERQTNVDPCGTGSGSRVGTLRPAMGVRNQVGIGLPM